MDCVNFEFQCFEKIEEIAKKCDACAYVEIWVGNLNRPAYCIIAKKTQICNNGNSVRVFSTDGNIFEVSTQNVVMRVFDKK